MTLDIATIDIIVTKDLESCFSVFIKTSIILLTFTFWINPAMKVEIMIIIPGVFIHVNEVGTAPSPL